MKILALLTFDIFRYSIGKALETLGHEVRYLERFDEELLENTILSFQPELVFSMGWDIWHVDIHSEGRLPNIKEILHRHQLFHVYFAEEDWLHFENWSRLYVAEVEPNFVLTRSASCIPKYENMGVPAVAFDVGCNPDFHKPGPSEPQYECDVAVIANGHFGFGEIRSKSISDLIIALFDQPFHTKIWGGGWDVVENYHDGKKAPEHMLQGKLPYSETPKVYSSAKICLSVQTCNDQLSNRTYDILSSGGFLLTSDTPAVREKLIPGVNCVTSNSPEDTVNLIKHYLAHPVERMQIAEAGREYAMAHFAYQKTIPLVWPQIMSAYEHFRINPLANRPMIHLEMEKMHFTGWTSVNAIDTAPGYLLPGGDVNSYIQTILPVRANQSHDFKLDIAREKNGQMPDITVSVQYLTADHVFYSYGLTDTFKVVSSVCQKVIYYTAKVPPEAAYALVIINKLPKPDSAGVILQQLHYNPME
ncbi:CgeB family protein [Brevibacillus migulae]|uniref:CgeB family protein n=1 Tax=Brevibacillus migulae TaxID=1644114 RepID=UPI00106EB4BE|nr:glycosyltransferase [Brevibacillus migulae]